jgi:hypothetical protein
MRKERIPVLSALTMSSVKHAFDIIVRAFWDVYFKRLVLFRSLIVHFCILGVSGFVLNQKLLSGVWVVWALLAAIYSYVLIIVTTHRTILLNSVDCPRWGEYRFTKREFRFLIMGIGIGILCIPLALLLAIPMAGLPLYWFGVAYITGRLSLLLPAAAIDENWSFQDAWNTSKTHQLTMGIIVFVFPFIVSLPSTALVFVISIFTTIYTIAALSIAFEDIKDGG